MWKCPTCGRTINEGVKVRRTPRSSRPTIIGFDTYDCYLKFWADVPNFEPLPEWGK